MTSSSKVLGAPLPARWRRWQWLKNTVIYYAVRAVYAALVRVRLDVLWPIATVLGHVAALVARSDRRRAEAQLTLAFPKLTRWERRRIVRRMFVHLAHCAVEALHIDEMFQGPAGVRLSDDQRALVAAALAEGKGVVAVSGHIGNWELFAQLLAKEGLPVTGIAKALYDPRLTRWVHEMRTRFGMQLLWRGDNNVSREMLRVFAAGGMLAMLVDQDTRVQGEFVPFFGRMAHTPTAPAVLALRSGAPVIVAWMHREGRRHVPHVERLTPERTGDRDLDVRTLTTQISARLEYAVRQHPEQWVWLHQRWRRQPEPV